MIFLLDSCILIKILRGDPDYQKRLSELRPQDTGICHHIYYELTVGLEKARLSQPAHVIRKKEKGLAQLLGYMVLCPFSLESVKEAAKIRAYLESRGNSLGAVDLLIAGTARSLGLTLITDNSNEFQRVPGLKVLQWRA